MSWKEWGSRGLEETCWWHGVHGSRWEYTGRKIRRLREEGWHGSCSKWAELWYSCLLCSLVLLGLSLDHILLLVLSLQLELVLNLVVVEALLDVNLVQLVNYLLLEQNLLALKFFKVRLWLHSCCTREWLSSHHLLALQKLLLESTLLLVLAAKCWSRCSIVLLSSLSLGLLLQLELLSWLLLRCITLLNCIAVKGRV